MQTQNGSTKFAMDQMVQVVLQTWIPLQTFIQCKHCNVNVVVSAMLTMTLLDEHVTTIIVELPAAQEHQLNSNNE